MKGNYHLQGRLKDIGDAEIMGEQSMGAAGVERAQMKGKREPV